MKLPPFSTPGALAKLPSGKVSRRAFVSGTVASGFLLTACGSSEAPIGGAVTSAAGADTSAAPTSSAATAAAAGTAAATSPAEGPWTFTDDSGKTVTLPKVPTRIVAFSTAAAALAEVGMTPQGIFAWSALEEDTQLRYVDLAETEAVGTAWAELNFEKIAALAPDIIVTMFDSGDSTLYGFADDAQVAKVNALAPIVSIDIVQPLLKQLDRFQELGKSLGADVGAADLLNYREQFNVATAELEAAAEGKSDLAVLVLGATTDSFNVAQISTNADLTYYQSLGVSMVEPDGEGIFYWEELSWEELAKYPADVILLDGRNEDVLAVFEAQPGWSRLPAVVAGQVGTWHAFDPPTYRFYVDAMNDLAPLIAESTEVT